jgi:hypothetical protein
MELQSIDNIERIRRENHNQNHYTVSLLAEAHRTGLIEKAAIDGIQGQIMLILRDLIMRYTGGESTSVVVETAERILNSVYYCIDAYIKNLHNPEEEIALLKGHNIKGIYEKGVEIIISCIAEAKELFKEILKRKLDVPLMAYNATIDEAFPDFFREYGVMFNAHDTMASIDYPLVFDDMKIQGIFYIKQYLEKLEIETEFCCLFKSADITKILINYGRINHIDYREPLVNIFELLFNNSVFSVLSGNNADRLVISKLQYDILLRRFNSIDSNELDTLINEAFDKLISELYIDHPKLIDYIDQYKKVFTLQLFNAIEKGNLQNIVITSDEEIDRKSVV